MVMGVGEDDDVAADLDRGHIEGSRGHLALGQGQGVRIGGRRAGGVLAVGQQQMISEGQLVLAMGKVRDVIQSRGAFSAGTGLYKEGVVSGAAGQDVAADSAGEGVVAGAADQGVGAPSAEQQVVAVTAVEAVGPIAAGDRVVPGAAIQGVVPIAPVQEILAIAARQAVVAAMGDQAIIARRPCQGLSCRRGMHRRRDRQFRRRDRRRFMVSGIRSHSALRAVD